MINRAIMAVKMSQLREKSCEDCKRMSCDSGCVCDCHENRWW
ncbi:MAG: hypothetical protein OEL77_07240 [Nitrosopumilus sp.]|nr:hypothetical protein [Nitrosopumilus sp.]